MHGTPICRDAERIPVAKLVIDVRLLQCNLINISKSLLQPNVVKIEILIRIRKESMDSK